METFEQVAAHASRLDVLFYATHLNFDPLRRGGQWVSYANPFSRAGIFWLSGNLFWLNLPHTGRKLRLYGTGTSYLNMRPLLEDWAKLLDLPGEGKIQPVIAARFPILAAAQANALLESGQVVGNVALAAPALTTNSCE